MMKISKTAVFKRILIYGSVLAITLLVALPFFANRLANTMLVKTQVASFVKQASGIDIPAQDFSIVLFPSPEFIIRNIDYEIDPEVSVQLSQIDLAINMTALIERKIKIDQITVSGVTLESVKKKENQSIVIIPEISSEFVQKAVTQLVESIPLSQETLAVRFDQISHDYFKNLKGTLYLQPGKKQVLLTATASDIRLTDKDLHIHDVPGLEMKKIQIDAADINLRADGSGRLELSCSIPHALKVFAASQTPVIDASEIELKYLLTHDIQTVHIDPLILKQPQGRVAVKFSQNMKSNACSIKFTGSHIHVGQARKNTLALLKTNETVNTLFDILRDGRVPKIHIAFSGKDISSLFDENHMILTGQTRQAKVKIPETDLMVTDLSSDVSVKKGVLSAVPQHGTISGSKILSGRFDIDLLNYKDTPFSGKFSLDINLKYLPKTLISLLPDTLLADELKRINQISGQARAELELDMPTGEQMPAVRVQTRGFPFTGLYERIPGMVNVENIVFAYADDVVTLTQVTGSVQNSRLENISAVIDFKQDTRLKINSGQARLDVTTLFPWITSFERPREMLRPVQWADGTINVSDFSISGPVLEPEQWRFDIAGQCLGLSLSTRQNQSEISRLFCQFHYSDSHLSFTDLGFDLVDLPRLASLTESRLAQSMKLPLSFKNAYFTQTSKKTAIRATMTAPELPRIRIAASGKTFGDLMVNRLELTDGQISDFHVTPLPNQEKPRFKFKGRLNTLSISKFFSPGSAMERKIDEYTQNQPVLIRSDASGHLHVHTRYLDLNPFFANQSATGLQQNTYLPDHKIELDIDTLKLKKFLFSDLKIQLSIDNGHSYFRINKALLCDLKTKGYFNIKDNVIFANIPFEAVEKPDVQNLFTCLLQKEQFMDGRYSISGHLAASSPEADFSKQIQGNVDFTAFDGRIYKLTLLSRILSVLNVSKIFKGKIPNVLQQGFTYKKVQVKADIKESRIYLNEAVIDGTDMTMIFKGWIDPVNDTLELTCLVAPFKTIDLIVKYIPIINTMFGGSLVSIPVKATGKLSDPDVIPLHPSAVGKGLIDMMSGILKTPVKLWDKIHGE